MDRNSLLKFSFFALAALLFFQFVLPKITGSDGPRVQPITSSLTGERKAPADIQVCSLKGPRFSAKLTSDGAALREFYVDGAKYTKDGKDGSPPMNLVTTPEHEAWRPLHFEWASAQTDRQVANRFFDWKLEESSETSCVFTYTDEQVQLRKVVRTVDRPFELEVEVTVKNVGAERASHRASVSTAAWRTEKEIAGGFGRQSPYVTQVECGHDGKVTNKLPTDFEPKDFAGPEFQAGWFRVPTSNVAFAATTNFYFAQAIIPSAGPTAPMCELQIEEFWDDRHYKSKHDAAEVDPNTGSAYKSRLAWGTKELAPGEAATYKVLHFMGPKEREVLAHAIGTAGGLSDLIQLGTFAIIAKVLVGYLLLCFSFTKSWGASIILLTVSVRLVLFPLTWKQIQSGLKMRLLKPEIDEINRKYGEDAQQKQLAIMELHRKNGISVAAGCLPALVQMPVWFALYSTLQTAAELYHVPFLWFRDLSAPDTFWAMGRELPFILPALLGATTFIQQKIMPQQMDPVQQKMMTYMLPAIFTAMMLFLPSGLGVYMFTNSVLGIVQQLVVERYYSSKQGGGGGGGSIEVREKDSSSRARDGKEGAVDLALGKGEAGV